jgi:DNA-binding transcriptional regulator of glucitol operon
MSLKAIHIVFIIASSLMTTFVGWWSFREYFTVSHSPAHLFFGFASVAALVGLLVYGRYFLRKLKHINYL